MEKLEIQEKEINASRIAVAEMAQENTDMRGLLGERKGELGKEKEVLEKKMEQQNKRYLHAAKHQSRNVMSSCQYMIEV